MNREEQVPGSGQQVSFSFAADFDPAEVSAKLPELKVLPGVLDVRLLEQVAQLQINFNEALISLADIQEKIKSLGFVTGGYFLKNNSAHDTTAVLGSREFSIGGMTCTGCEQRLERVLKRIAGVTEVKADYVKGKIKLTCLSETPTETFIAAIEKLGYTAVLTPNLPVTETAGVNAPAGAKANNNFNIMQLIGIGIILIAVWLILNHLGVFNMLPKVNSSMGYGLIFVVGMITSLHCLAMCGGINLSQSIAKSGLQEEIKPVKIKLTMSQFVPGLLYNTGRVISYTLLGGIVGSLGSLISFSQGLQGVIVLIAGFFMVLMGINMLDVIPALRRFTVRMPKFLSRIAERNSSRGPLVVGLLNGLMPCGPLQSMQLYALGTGSFWAGALSMFLFSLGTVPLMLGFSMVSSLLNKRFTHRMLKISALLVLLLGTAMVGRGLSLSGFNLNSVASSPIHSVARIEGGKQYVTSTLTNNSYEPIFVQSGIPVEWTLTATDDNLNGCNNPVIIPKYNIKKQLVAGENLIQFTPTESGTIAFSCWMGMINSSIRVVDDLAKVDAEQVKNAAAPALADVISSDVGTSQGGTSQQGGSGQVGVARLESGVQKVTTALSTAGYDPIIVQRGIPVEWTITADNATLSSCNNRMIIPRFNITQTLQAGDNVIRFTPTTIEDIPVSCWMGMINSGIKVVEDLAKVDDNTKQQAQSLQKSGSCCSSGSNGGGGGCCGGGNPNGFVQKTESINIPLDKIQIAKIKGDTQYIDIDVDKNGYSPAAIVAQKGLATKITFRGLNLDDENYRMLVPAYGARVELKTGDNPIDFTTVGDFYFVSWHNVYRGFVKVVPDLNQINLEQVRKEIKNYQIPSLQ